MGLLGKLFGKKPDGDVVKAEELNPAELQFLRGHREAFVRFQRLALLKGDYADDAPRLGEELIAWWHEQPVSSRPDANDLVWAIGAAVGDYLARRTNMRWMVVTDSFGTALSLYATDSNRYTQLVLSPVDSVGKRFESPSPGDLEHYAKSAITQIDRMRQT